jgi:endoglucanase
MAFFFGPTGGRGLALGLVIVVFFLLVSGATGCFPLLVGEENGVADAHGITYQMELLPRGGTDAGVMQRARTGAPAATLSIPTRNIHTVNEMVHRADLDAVANLLARYLEEAHTGDYRL